MPTIDAPTRPARPARAPGPRPRRPQAGNLSHGADPRRATDDAYASRGAAALAPARRPAPRPAPAPADRGRHLRVVAPAERVRRRLTPALGVLLTAGLFAMLFAVAIAHTMLVQGQIRLDAIDAELATEQARYQALRTEVAQMESPARVVEAAHALGMVTPDDLVYLQPAAEPLTTPAAGEVRGSTTTLGEDGAGEAGDQAGSDARDAGADRDAEADSDAAGASPDGWTAMKPLLRATTP